MRKIHVDMGHPLHLKKIILKSTKQYRDEEISRFIVPLANYCHEITVTKILIY